MNTELPIFMEKDFIGRVPYVEARRNDGCCEHEVATGQVWAVKISGFLKKSARVEILLKNESEKKS